MDTQLKHKCDASGQKKSPKQIHSKLQVCCPLLPTSTPAKSALVSMFSSSGFLSFRHRWVFQQVQNSGEMQHPLDPTKESPEKPVEENRMLAQAFWFYTQTH